MWEQKDVNLKLCIQRQASVRAMRLGTACVGGLNYFICGIGICLLLAAVDLAERAATDHGHARVVLALAAAAVREALAIAAVLLIAALDAARAHAAVQVAVAVALRTLFAAFVQAALAAAVCAAETATL